MDDLLLFTLSKNYHIAKLKDLLKALLKIGLKISPKKCQLFRTNLQYMGNKIFIKDKRVCIKPLSNRLEAIQKLHPPTTVNGCRSFTGMVNFLSMFCPELQKLLKQIFHLTQEAFEEIKHRLIKPLVLHMPNTTGRFHWYSDTSQFATGSRLYQIQNGQPKLIAYVSKQLPEAAKNYSITELELCGLAINIASFSHLLKRVDFDVIIDHLALTHIHKSKAEPATARIKRLLEIISLYSVNLFYIKGKDMVLSDFLSRQNHNDSNPHDIIPVSFNMYQVLHEKYYNIANTRMYLVQTWSQTKSSGSKLPEVHGMSKNLDPNILSEKQHTNPIKGNTEKPCIGQGRTGMSRRPFPVNQTIIQPSDLSQKNPGAAEIETRITDSANFTAPVHSLNNANERVTHRRSLPTDVPFYPGPTYRPPPKPIRSFTPESHESLQSSNG